MPRTWPGPALGQSTSNASEKGCRHGKEVQTPPRHAKMSYQCGGKVKTPCHAKMGCQQGGEVKTPPRHAKMDYRHGGEVQMTPRHDEMGC